MEKNAPVFCYIEKGVERNVLKVNLSLYENRGGHVTIIHTPMPGGYVVEYLFCRIVLDTIRWVLF